MGGGAARPCSGAAEAGPRAGNQHSLAAQGSWRKDLLRILDWRLAQLDRLGVPVRLNTNAEAEDMLAGRPDLVIVAAGGVPAWTACRVPKAATAWLIRRSRLIGRPWRRWCTTVRAATTPCCAPSGTPWPEPRDTVTLDGRFAEERGGRRDELIWRRGLAEFGVAVRHDLQLVAVQVGRRGPVPSRGPG